MQNRVLMKKITLTIAALFIAQATFAIKIIEGPYLQAVTENSVTIVWQSDKVGLSWVEIAPDDDSHFYAAERPKYYEVEFGRRKLGTHHCITIEGLERGTTYRYRVATREVVSNEKGKTLYGYVASTDVYRKRPLEFRTLNHSLEKVSVAIIGGTQGSKKLEAEMPIDRADFNLVLYNGGMASSTESRNGGMPRFIATSVQHFAKQLPLFMVRGVEEAQGTLGRDYMRYFPSTSGMPYYTLREGNICFIVLDSGGAIADIDANTDFTTYRKEQQRWLIEALKSEEVIGAEHKIALMHLAPVKKSSEVAEELHQLFVTPLEEAGIDLMICCGEEQKSHKAGSIAKFPILIEQRAKMLVVQSDGKRLFLNGETEK